MRTNHASMKLKKVFELKTRQVYFIYTIPCLLKLGKSLETCCVNFFPLKLRKICILESIFFAKQALITHTKLCVQHFQTGKNFCTNQCHKQRVLLFSRKSCFIKAGEKRFSLCLHNLIETLKGLGEFLTVMQTLYFVLGLHDWLELSKPSNVYIRLCKQGKHFLLLK